MEHIQFRAIESRKGLPIIEAIVGGNSLLLHSKYDPEKEAERLIESYKDKIEKADHILFYGAGMGYHIKAFFKQYPEKIASVYEPFEAISKLTIAHQNKTKVPLSLLQHYVVRTEARLSLQSVSAFKQNLNQSIEIIALPSYGEWQEDQLKEFVEMFKQMVDIKQGDLLSAFMFSRRWTINALMNLPKIMQHSNFLVEKKRYFQGKPVIIIGAGPSLSEEIENLRVIKEKGLAYLFAVGSAYKALIKANIFPDAVCTYDPQNHNFAVFEELVDNKINTIPMIYGTTVGFETLDYYNGPKLYFPISQDRLTAHFRRDLQVFVSDATTIAIVTLQLLNLLQVSKVILVGQNFAFKKDKYYADGIQRFDEKNLEVSDNTTTDKDLEIPFEVEDVHGGKVLTNDEFRRMKNDMETCLTIMTMPVINTTNGGAAIKGATFKRLEQLINEDLTTKVVVDDWWENTDEKRNVLNKPFLQKYCKALEQFEQQEEAIQLCLDDLEQTLSNLSDGQIQQKLKKFDSLFQTYHRNTLYETTILPIAQTPFEKLVSENELILAMTYLKQKAVKVIEVYTTYIKQCRMIYEDIAPVVSNYTLPKLNELIGQKMYIATSGVFHYEGAWSKKIPPEKEKVPEDLSEEEKRVWYKQKKLEDRIELPVPTVIETTEKGSTFQFRFKGSSISLYGLNQKKQDLKLKVQVDQKKILVNIKGSGNISEDQYIRNNIFSINNLKHTMHEVTIEILSDTPHFLFEGIEINDNGRAYHIHEVERVEELKVGKRIRCHYEATYYTVGDFNDLGAEVANFLPTSAEPEPNGDFYFIMVDEIAGEKKLIADRNIQSFMSYTTLKKKLLNNQQNVKIDGYGYITLPSMGRFKADNENDWYKYIESKNYPNEAIYWNFIEHTINFGSDIPNDYPEKGVFRGKYHNGKGTSFGVNAHDWFMITGVDGAYSTYAFRPMLIGENRI